MSNENIPQGFETTVSKERFHEASAKFIELVERCLSPEADETSPDDEAYMVSRKRYEVGLDLAQELSGTAPINTQITAVELLHEYEKPYDESEKDATHHYGITLWQKGGYLTGSSLGSDAVPCNVSVRLDQETGRLSADYAGGRNLEDFDYLGVSEQDAEFVSLFCQTAEMIVDQQAE